MQTFLNGSKEPAKGIRLVSTLCCAPIWRKAKAQATKEKLSVIFRSIDCHTPSLRELLETVEALKQGKIDLLSLEEKIDTSSAAGELIFHVFGAIAHFERRLIAERTRDGIESARAKGKRLGRPPLDPEKLDAAFKLIDAGTSPTETANQLGLGRSTLYREIKKKKLASA